MTGVALLEVDKLVVQFGGRSRSLSRLRRGDAQASGVRAVNDVSFGVFPSETLGLVGESGSGKSTVARSIVGLVRPTLGDIRLFGRSMQSMSRKEMRTLRAKVQMVFQDPASSLNPSMKVEDIVAEPLDIHEGLTRAGRQERVVQAIHQVGLDESALSRLPSSFSGGQKQRIGIARAIVLRPELIICDEAVSALDLSTQSQVLNLLKSLQQDMGLSYLFIGHDLAVVRWMSDRIGVMHRGRLVEHGPADQVINSPAHPYTAALIDSIPVIGRDESHKTSDIYNRAPDRESPMPPDGVEGCEYRYRCAHAMDVCGTIPPDPLPLGQGSDNHWARCHLLDPEAEDQR